MNSKVFIFLMLTLIQFPLFGQNYYTGVNSLNLLAEGPQQTATSTSDQMVAKVKVQDATLDLLVKVASFELNSISTSSPLTDVFILDYNPLMHISLDLTSGNIDFSQPIAQTTFILPTEIEYNGVNVSANATLTLESNGNDLKFDVSVEAPMQAFGINPPASFTQTYSSLVRFSVTNGNLSFRY